MEPINSRKQIFGERMHSRPLDSNSRLIAPCYRATASSDQVEVKLWYIWQTGIAHKTWDVPYIAVLIDNSNSAPPVF